MPDFPIIDTHVHLWDTGKLKYPWLQDIPILNRQFLHEDFKQAAAEINIEAMVFMQCEVEFSQGLAEVEWVTGLASAESKIKAIIPWAPMEKGDESRIYLDRLKSNSLIKGVRRLIQSEPDPEFCLKSDFIKGIQILSGYNFSFDICISHRQMANTIKMVRKCPNTIFILDHIGKPDIKNHVLEPWKSDIRTLSQNSNVYCKISGMVTEADHQKWSNEDLDPYLEHVIESFGFDRVMFGGDWPVATLATKYPVWIKALDWALKGCSEDELIKFYRKNAERIYKI
ncbi:MAG: amidohydrolase family protein [Lentisphaerae bacterium]|nr:amidohydrolase family protein [Lentisphaerota bacterium]